MFTSCLLNRCIIFKKITWTLLAETAKMNGRLFREKLFSVSPFVVLFGLLLRLLLIYLFLFCHFSRRLCPSTAGCGPPSVPSIVLCLLFSCFRRSPPSLLCLLLGRPFDLFPLLGCHSVQRLVHLLSFILAVFPAHFDFCSSVYSIVSVIFVLFLICGYGIFSCSFRCRVFLHCSLSSSQFVCQVLFYWETMFGHCWQDTLFHYLFFEWYRELLSWSISFIFFPNSSILLYFVLF